MFYSFALLFMLQKQYISTEAEGSRADPVVELGIKL